MSSNVTHNVKAVVRDSTNKVSYVTVGRATTDDQGRIAIKIDTLPYDLTQWTGWLNLFHRDSQAFRSNPASSGFDDDIPF